MGFNLAIFRGGFFFFRCAFFMKNITCENIIEFVKRAFELENKFSVRYHQIELSGCKQVEYP